MTNKQSKRRLLLFILVLAISLMISIGLSLWIISDNIKVKPELEIEDVIIKYLDNNETKYDGNIQLPSNTYLGLDNELTYYYKQLDDTDYTLVDLETLQGPINADDYLIKVVYYEQITSDDGTIITIDKSIEGLKFKILKNSFSLSEIAFDDKEVVYDRKTHMISVTGTLPAPVTNVEYYIESALFTGAIDVGTYNVTAKFIYDTINYETVEDMEATLTISKKSISLSELYFDGYTNNSFIYTGNPITEITSSFKVKDNDGTILEKDKDYTVSFSETTNLGASHTVTVNGIGNYTGTKSENYVIKERMYALIVTPNNNAGSSFQSVNYNGEIQRPSVNVLDEEGNEVDGVTLSYSIDTKNQGRYVVTVTASKEGYNDGSCDATILINSIPLTVSWSNTSFTYDKTSHIPTATVNGIITGDSVTTVVSSSQINAGTYTATLSLEGNENGNYILPSNITCGFTIAKRNISLSENLYELPYSSTVRVWTSTTSGVSTIKDAIAGKVTFTGVLEGDTVNPVINGMHNNIYAYGTVSVSNLDKTMTKVVGSTYEVNTGIDNDNYNLVSSTFILKYKTVMIDSDTTNFYTIEDAFSKASSKIWFNGDSTGTDTYVTTSFTGLSLDIYNRSTSYSLNGVKLIVPYTSSVSTTLSNNFSTTKNNSVTGNVYSALIIPENIVITITNSGGIAVASTIDYSQSVYTTASTTRGVLVNNGTINVTSGSIYAFGYIKGKGYINLSSNTTMMEMMTIYDWHGGSATSAMYKNVFPVNAWSMRNNLCTTTISSGATYLGKVYVVASSTGADIDCEIIGKNSSSNCLFKPISSGETGAIVKSLTANDTDLNELNKITSYNQARNMNVKDKITIESGNYTDAEMSMSKTILFMTVELSTSNTKPLPISYMDIVINNGAELSLTSSDYLFFPGTCATIEEGGIVNIGENIDITFASCSNIFDNDIYKDYSTWFVNEDSYMVVNGSLIVSGNVGGLVTSNVSGANVDLKSGTPSSIYKSVNNTKDPYYYTSSPINAIGCINGVNGSLFETKNNYIYNGSYWFKENITITYMSNGANEACPAVSLTIDSEGYELVSLPSVSKTGHTFNGWYLDEALTKLANNETIYYDVTLYAKWEINSYSIVFNTDGGTTIDTITAEYNSIINSPNVPNKDGYIFNGWIDTNGVKVSFPINMPVGGLSLTAQWISETVTTYNVTFNSNGGSTIDTVTIESGAILNSSAYVTTRNGYTFVEWQLDGVSYDFTQPVMSDLELVAAWSINDYPITYNTFGGTLSDSTIDSYTIESTTFDLPTSNKTGYTFKGWYLASDFSGNAITEIVQGSYGSITLYAKYEVISYNITYNLDGGVNNSANPSTYTIEDEIIFKDPTKEGYTFNGWSPTKIEVGTTEDITVTASWTKESSGCLAEGTLITMADGTMKKVEDVLKGDLLIVFNHETGQYDIAEVLFNDSEQIANYNVVNLVFSNGSIVRVVDEHGFYNLELNKYIYIDEFNYNEFIGDRFVASTVIDGNIVQSVVTLDEAYVTSEYIRIYSPVTVYHLNYITENILSMPGGITGLFNIFEMNDDLTINLEKMQEDIEKYGLYTYEDFKDYIPYEVYAAFPAPYFKVAVGKGYITWEEILGLIDRYLSKMV